MAIYTKLGHLQEARPKKTRQGNSNNTKLSATSRNSAKKKYRGQDLGLSHIVLESPDYGQEIYRTPLGGFLNHSEEPNCVKWKVFVPHKYLYSVKTIKPIKKGEELFLKYTFYKVL